MRSLQLPLHLQRLTTTRRGTNKLFSFCFFYSGGGQNKKKIENTERHRVIIAELKKRVFFEIERNPRKAMTRRAAQVCGGRKEGSVLRKEEE